MPRLKGEAHPHWKGESAGYVAKHNWVSRHKERTLFCRRCGAGPQSTNFHNVSGEYRRALGDYIEVCISCHRALHKERRMKSEQVNVKEVPASLYAAVERDAAERDRNRNDVICEILATRFRVAYEPTGYPFRPATGSDQWTLRMPSTLRAAINRAADEASSPGRQIAVSRLIFSTLQAHYDLPVESPRRRPSQPPLDPSIVREARARHEAGESLRSLAERYKVKRETLTRAIRAA